MAGSCEEEINFRLKQVDPGETLNPLSNGLDIYRERDSKRIPRIVPITPTLAPVTKKIRRIMPRVAPMVRRIAIPSFIVHEHDLA